jgi:hypothetical protein
VVSSRLLLLAPSPSHTPEHLLLVELGDSEAEAGVGPRKTSCFLHTYHQPHFWLPQLIPHSAPPQAWGLGFFLL